MHETECLFKDREEDDVVCVPVSTRFFGLCIFTSGSYGELITKTCGCPSPACNQSLHICNQRITGSKSQS